MPRPARFACRLAAAAGIAASALLPNTVQAGTVQAAQPLTIGFDIEETGGLAPNGKAVLLATQIWAQDVNAHGGLLGRQVKLDYYDDQSNPALVPGIITKLLDIDKVDILIGGNGTNMLAPAMPMVMQRKLTFLGLFGLDVNSEFHDPDYFSMIPAGGEHPKQSFTAGFFAVAAEMTPKPQTIAIVGADTDFSKNAMDGGVALAKKAGLKIVYDKTYPASTIDYSPVVRAIQATSPDLVLVCSYPPDTVGMIHAASEIGLKTRLFGGGMVGLQATAIKMQLGPLMNGIVNYDFWLPWAGNASPAAKAFLATYQAKAPAAGVDRLGYYLAPFAYARMQVLQQAVLGTNGLDQEKLAAYLKSHTFKTVVGDIAFGPNGEWKTPRVLETQFQGVAGNGLAQFKDPKTDVILWPTSLKTGTLRAPYDAAAH